jgi:tetratricopeptide (TPR) repeat protein
MNAGRNINPQNANGNSCLQRALSGALQPEVSEVVMNIRMVVGSMLALLLCPLVSGQTAPQDDNVSPKQEVLQRIAVAETAVRQTESAHQDNVALGRSYIQIGLWYEDAGLWNKAEADLEHAVALFRQASEPGDGLAEAVVRLGSLHAIMERFGESEKEEMEALKLRQNLGDQLQIARSWDDLGGLYLAQHKYAKAKDIMQQAVTEFLSDGRATSFDRISSRYTLSLALCYLKDYQSAFPVVKAALDEANTTLQPNDLPVGFGDFLLGYIYWKFGDPARADEYMARGKAILADRLGWQHPTYLGVARQYARFLRENRRVEEAEAVERQIRQAEAVVDVGALQTQKGPYGLVGLR